MTPDLSHVQRLTDAQTKELFSNYECPQLRIEKVHVPQAHRKSTPVAPALKPSQELFDLYRETIATELRDQKKVDEAIKKFDDSDEEPHQESGDSDSESGVDDASSFEED